MLYHIYHLGVQTKERWVGTQRVHNKVDSKIPLIRPANAYEFNALLPFPNIFVLRPRKS